MKPSALQASRPRPVARKPGPPADKSIPSAPSLQPAAVAPAAPHAGGGTLRSAGSVAVLVLVNLRPAARWWGWSRLVLGRWPLRGVPGLGFVKVLGSGAGGGFGIAPSGTHQGLFLVFDGEAAARSFIDNAPVLRSYQAHAQECCVALLRACTSKGSWAGAAMETTAPPPLEGRIAALTRAAIRPRHALAFWRLSPPAEAALEAAPGCLLAAGLGEAPVLRQATFSLWSSAAALDAYARGGAHQQAIRSAYGGGYFAESMFVRFVPLEIRGVWKGQHHG